MLRRLLSWGVGPNVCQFSGDPVTDGKPTSSSTLPGLVVTMYRHAVIADDSRVLVTTGTGHGTALLCRRLGDERGRTWTRIC